MYNLPSDSTLLETESSSFQRNLDFIRNLQALERILPYLGKQWKKVITEIYSKYYIPKSSDFNNSIQLSLYKGGWEERRKVKK